MSVFEYVAVSSLRAAGFLVAIVCMVCMVYVFVSVSVCVCGGVVVWSKGLAVVCGRMRTVV